MASESRVKIVGQITSSPAGVTQINTAEIVNSDAPIAQTQLNLESGDNEIDIPTNAKGVVILFDSAGTEIKILKGDPADVGITIALNTPQMLTFDDPPPETFVISFSGEEADDTVTILQWF